MGAPGTGAHWRYKSSRELITANEAKRNCMRATECGKGKRSCEPMNKNRIEGVAEQGERAWNREALVIKARRRRSGGCAAKECVLTRGDLALRLKGRRLCRSEKSAEVVIVRVGKPPRRCQKGRGAERE